MKADENKAMTMTAAILGILAISMVPSLAFAQTTSTTTTSNTDGQPNIIIVPQPNGTTNGPVISDTLSQVILAIVAAVGAIVAFLQNRQNLVLVHDKNLQAEAIKDMATLVAEAYALNADGSVTAEEYNAFMETKVKPIAMKYGDKFGIAQEIQRIFDSFKKPPTAPPASGLGPTVAEQKQMEREGQ